MMPRFLCQPLPRYGKQFFVCLKVILVFCPILSLLCASPALRRSPFARYEIASSKSQTDNEQSEQQVTPPVILTSGKVQYTEEARAQGIEGIVVLSVNLAADGNITDVRVVQGLPYGLTEKAIEAAQQIRFRPSQKNGVPSSIRINVEYKF